MSGLSIRKDIKILHSNVLNHAKEDLSRDQKRILYLCLKEVNESKWPSDGLFKISSKHYATVYGMMPDEATKDLKKAIAEFRGKTVTVFDDIDGIKMKGEIDWTSSRWESVSKERGVYSVKIDPDLKQHLVPLLYARPITISFFEELAALKYKYSQRLYACLSQFRGTGEFRTTAEKLHELWLLPPSYKKWSLMKMRAIDPAVEDLQRFEDFKTLTYTTKQNSESLSILFQFTPKKEN